MGVTRLLDEIDQVEVTSAWDLGDRDEVQRRTSRVFESLPCDRLDGFRSAAGAVVRRMIGRTEARPADAGEPGVRLDSDGGGGIRVAGPAAFWIPLPAPPELEGAVAMHTVSARIAADEDAEYRVCILRLEKGEAEDLSSPEIARSLYHGRAPATSDLRPAGVPDDRGRVVHRAIHPWAARHAYVLGVVVRHGAVSVDEIVRASPTPLGAQLERTAPPADASPWRRRVKCGQDDREALVFMAPGEARWTVDVPSRGAELTLGLAHFVPEDAAAVRLTLLVRAADDSGRAISTEFDTRNDPSLDTWTKFAFSLDSYAGERVEIVLAARPAEDGAVVGVALANPMVTARPAPSEARPPDVLLISLDTVRADRVSAYGYPRDTTPTLAALADRAAIFTNAIAPAPWTLPSHVTILSGQLPDRHGVRHTSQRIDPTAVPLLAREFRARGYRTVAVTGGGYVAPDFGFAEGFEEYRVGDPSPPLHLDSELALEISAASRRRIDDVLAEPRDRPVFLFAHTYVAHEYRSEVEDLVAVGVPPERAATFPQDREWMTLRGRMRGSGEKERFADELAEVSVRYDAALRAADRLVEHVLVASRARERPDDCLVVVLSDHGEELGEHGDFGHAHDVTEELLRVPLLFYGAGVTPGRTDAVVSLADVAPTIRALLGFDSLSELTDGRSLVPALRAGEIASEPALAVSGTPTRLEKHALRGDRWKLKVTRGSDGARKLFLYDLDGAGEHANVVDAEAGRAAQIDRLLAARVLALRRLEANTQQAELSPEREAELRALGYLGGE